MNIISLSSPSLIGIIRHRNGILLNSLIENQRIILDPIRSSTLVLYKNRNYNESNTFVTKRKYSLSSKTSFSTTEAATTTTTSTTTSEQVQRQKNRLPAGYTYVKGSKVGSNKKDEITTAKSLFAGLPFVFFTLMSFWVLNIAYSGKLKDLAAVQGRSSKSFRQIRMEEERDNLLQTVQKPQEDLIPIEKLNNTKRIIRPEEVLEQRRQERIKRNKWYRRFYRYITGKQ
jgi:hypothetical protein